MAIHLPFGGSSAARTLACPGWVKASEGLPNRTSQAAVDGSMHHEVQEHARTEDKPPVEYLGLVYKEGGLTKEFKDDDLPLANIAYHATDDLLDEYDIDEMMIEPFVTLIPHIAGGSVDLLGLSSDRQTILVIDYKFGRGIVSATDNKQAMSYALSALRDRNTKSLFEEVEYVVLAIVQPQARGVIDKHVIPIEAVLKFEVEYRAAIDEGRGDNPRKAAGDHCHFCPATATCTTRQALAKSALMMGADGHNALLAGADMLTQVEDWCKEMREGLFMMMKQGIAVPGWKIVAKDTREKFIDPDDTLAFLSKKKGLSKAALTKTTMLTPAQTRAVIKKAKLAIDIDDRVTRPHEETLALEGDKREAIFQSDVTGALADLMEEG